MWYHYCMPEEKKIAPVSPEISPEPVAPEGGILVEKERKEEEKPVTAEEGGRESFVAPGSAPQKPLEPQRQAPPSAKSEELQAIEDILEEDLEEAYWQLPPSMREQFKKRGEDTAKKIERLVRAVRLNILKVLRLLQKWLSLIPHVNTFFLEQEAKIKADKIVALHRERSKRP